ncbi:MAG: sigma 54-interacting transcriptional regulator [Syntrophobacteraceae bacterium]
MNTVEYKEVLDEAHVGIVAVDASGKISYANQAAELLLGIHSGGYCLTLPITEIMPALGVLVLDCLRTGKACTDWQFLRGDIKFSADITLIYDAESAVRGAVCCLMTLKSHPIGEVESCRAINRQLNAIFESSSDGIWVCDGRGNVISINSASEKLNGVSAANIVGRHVADIRAEGLFDRSVTLEVLETGRQVSIIQNIRKTGKTLLVTGTPVIDDGGAISMVVVNERDITQLSLIREQLDQTRMVTEKYRDELAGLSIRELEKHEIVAENGEMRKVITAALKLAHLDASNILVLGESGTGKGLLAKFIHKNGKRSKKPVVQINCAALPESLLEAELFGYEKGAFTGARSGGKAGLFELAQEGTLFLDEIGDLPLLLQAKLLKYLDDFEVMRLGSLKSIKVDCAVIAATNQDLEKQTKNGQFRRDLLYRLNTFTIRIPPLRERADDIFELAEYFLRKYNRSFHTKKRISPAAMDFLLSYPFPGNVRELKSIIKRAVFLSEKDLLEESIMEISGGRHENAVTGRGRMELPQKVNEAERAALEIAVKQCRNTRELALYLGISQPTVVRKLRKHGFGRLDSLPHRDKRGSH